MRLNWVFNTSPLPRDCVIITWFKAPKPLIILLVFLVCTASILSHLINTSFLWAPMNYLLRIEMYHHQVSPKMIKTFRSLKICVLSKDLEGTSWELEAKASQILNYIGVYFEIFILSVWSKVYKLLFHIIFTIEYGEIQKCPLIQKLFLVEKPWL